METLGFFARLSFGGSLLGILAGLLTVKILRHLQVRAVTDCFYGIPLGHALVLFLSDGNTAHGPCTAPPSDFMACEAFCSLGLTSRARKRSGGAPRFVCE